MLMPIAIDKERAAEFLSLSITTLEKLQQRGDFPKPRQLSDRRVAYLVSELTEWMYSRPVSNLLPPENTGAPKSRAQ